MSRYVKNEEATIKAVHQYEGEDWYTAFGDVCYYLKDPKDGGENVYWQSRDSAMLIRGGANYAYEQVTFPSSNPTCMAYSDMLLLPTDPSRDPNLD